MTLDDIKRVDPKGMYRWIADFPKQVEEAVAIGKRAAIKLNAKRVRNIVLTGLGGSAIGGDLLRTYLSEELKIPFIVNRHYFLPAFVGTETLVIVSSYSGNTEETIAAHKDATKRKAQVLCISTGGETSVLAKKFKQPWIQIPGGLSPRAALGYSFFPLLVAFQKLGLIKSKEKEIKETIALLKQKSAVFADPTVSENAPLRLAEQLHGKLPIVYSTTEHLDAVNLRFRGQAAENAKQLAFGHVLPEMNHNELVGWNVLTDVMKQMHVVFLKDKTTHKRVAMREAITKDVVSKYAAQVSEVWSDGVSLLARMFYLIHFNDWVSLYLAVMNNKDPEPVAVIDYLKNELAKVK
ncbi:MAG: bifunctional phosphoglucose/phosphomannose isomerase [Ignavibacteriales bacterium]|nr:bifunctional phosphoglucose/phosphomannose isomerase [Ignavibacteriales bacterium]